MRNRETHFEQIPIAVAEAVLRETTAAATRFKKSPARAPAAGQSETAFAKNEKSTPSKGRS
jgi:hypothetical protein